MDVSRRLCQTPEVSQRIFAKELRVSLGSLNFCFQALVETGWIKIQNFSRNKNELRYACLLTPAGLAENSELAAEFLSLKVAEYETLQVEIKGLNAEMNSAKGAPL